MSFLIYFFLLKFIELGSICCNGGFMRFRVDADLLTGGVKE